MDSDDISRGWLLSRVLGRQGESLDEEDRNGNSTGSPRMPGRGKWGARGISVSADDDVEDPWHLETGATHTGDSKQKGNEFAEILEDDEDLHDDSGIISPDDGAKGEAIGFRHGGAVFN